MLLPSATCLVLSTYFSITNAFPQQTYKSVNFKVPEMQITKSGTTAPGYLFFGLDEAGASEKKPLIMTDDNDLIWAGPAIDTQNFKTQDLNGKPVLSYFQGHADSFGHGYGRVNILDNTYEQIDEICLDASDVLITTPTGNKYPCYNDYHESYITDKGTILVNSFNVTRYDLSPFGGVKKGWIFDWVFFEVDVTTKKILFQWNALDHVNPATSNYVNPQNKTVIFDGVEYGAKQSLPWDFFHGNSVAPVPGGYIVNSRMTWSTYKVNAGTGEVEWTLEGSKGGDFTFEDPVPSWSWQHMPRLITKTYTPSKFQISLFNNDNIRGAALDPHPVVSSGYILEIDTDSKKVSAARKLVYTKNQIKSPAQGSTQLLDGGHVLLGYGAKPFIDEYDKHDNLIYRAQFADLTGPISHSYRAYKLSWKGYPKNDPKVYFEPGSIYASWNGATEYDAWNFYTGDSDDQLDLVGANITRKGFETRFKTDKGGKYARVEALVNGEAVGKSSTVQIHN